MDFLLEFLLELVFEGSFELLSEKKAPLGLRIAIAAVMLLVYVGLFGLLMYVAISTKHPFVIIFVTAVTVGITVMFVIAIIKQFKKSKKRKRE